MRLLFVLLALAAATAGAAVYYEIHGHLAAIEAEQVARPKFYGSQGELVRKQLQTLIPDKFVYFSLREFQIHGAAVEKSTAIFYGYLTLNEEVDVSEMKIAGLEIFYFSKRDQLPNFDVITDNDDAVNCINGGLILPNNTCACPAFYTGQNCEQPVCMNYGIVDGNRCACPPGHYSVNCEPRGCLPAIQDNFDNSKQTFILVLNQRSTMAYVMNSVITGMQNTLKTIYLKGGQIDNYILINYIYTSQNAYYMNQKMFKTETDFLNYLYGVHVTDGESLQYTQQAIYAAQNFDPYMHGFSNLFVFTDATDIEGSAPVYQISSNASEINVITKTIAWRNRIVYLLSQMQGQPIDNSGNSYDTYRRVAAATLGDIISFDMTETQTIMNQVIPLYMQNENVYVTYSTNSTSVNIPSSEGVNVTVLITVEPNGAFPIIPTNPFLITVSAARFQVLSGMPAPFNITGSYSLRAFVNSGKTVLLGYSTDPLIDIGSAYIPAEVPPPYVSAALIGFTNNSVTYSFIDNTGSMQWTTPTTTNPAGPRPGMECSFPLSFGQFKTSLDPAKDWAMLNIGTAVRIVPAFSGMMDYHTAVPWNCFNGGTLIGPKSCLCSGLFVGPNCATPACLNLGKVNPFPGNGNPLCLCHAGYGGDHCEVLACPIQPEPNYGFGRERTLAIVLQTSMSQAGINANILAGFTNIIGTLSGLDAFSGYSQTTFNNIVRDGQNYTQILNKDYEDANNFLYALQSDNIQYLATSSQTQDSLAALDKAITLLDNEKSSIFLFTDSPPQSQFSENEIIALAVSRQLEINIVITPPYGMSELCMSGGDANLYRDIAQKTGGMVLNLCQPYGNYSTDPLLTFLNSYGPSHHHTENLNEVLGANTISMSISPDNSRDTLFAFVNCEKEHQVVVFTDMDTTINTTLSPIASIPFVGIYQLAPSATNVNGYFLQVTPVGGGACSVRVSEKTQNSVYLAFSPNPSVDRLYESLTYGQITSIVAHPYAGSYLINTTNIQIQVFTDDQTELYCGSATRRTNCEYDYYFAAPFICTESQQTFIFTTTVTTVSGTFIRTQRGYCYHDFDVCLNGGTYDADDYRCICTSDYEGDFCENPICQNGATMDSFRCLCASGYTGQFCQYGSCDTWNFMETNDVRETDFKQLTFVLSINQPQLLVNVMLDSILSTIIQNTEQPATPTQYSLIMFDENGYYDIISTAHQQKFLDTFHSSINMITRTSPSRNQALAALSESYKLNIQPPDIVYLFTGTDTDLSGSLTTVIRQKLGSQINLFYTPQAVTYPDQPKSNLEYVSRTARQTGGRVLPILPDAVASLAPVLISTVKEDAMIADDGLLDCTAGVQFYFFVESVFSRVVIEITGAGVSQTGNAQIIDGNNQNVTTSILFTDNAALALSVDSSVVQPVGGRWVANVKTTIGSCYIQVRSQSPVRVIPGFTSSATSDFVKDGPFTTFGNDPTTYMTFRVIDRNNSDVDTVLTTLSLYHTQYYQSWKPTDTALISNIRITQRDPTNCASQYMATWQMDVTWSYWKMVVQGRDANRFQFQRTFYFNLPSSSRDNVATCGPGGKRNNFGECECDANHSGNYCNMRVCQNGGSSSYGICACPNGYYSDYCEQYIIIPGNTTSAPFTI